MSGLELKCDVLVVGGGISGVVAALAASRAENTESNNRSEHHVLHL